MKKLLTTAASLLLLMAAMFTLTACGDDNKKNSPSDDPDKPQFNTYAHYRLDVGSDLTHFYDINITYLSLDGIEHKVTLDEGQTEWTFDATTEYDVPVFKCYMELVAKSEYSDAYTPADYFDFSYHYKCTAYSPTVGIKVSENTYTNTLQRDKVDQFVHQNPTRLILDFPQEY